MQVNFLVGGEAGQGVQTIGYVLAKYMARLGFHVFADQDYESRVRGGHNFFRVRGSDSPVQAQLDDVDILVAINRDTVELHRSEVKPDGVIIFDSEKDGAIASGKNALGIPLERIAVETTSDKVMANTVATGAALAVAGFDIAPLSGVLRDQFKKAGAEVIDKNIKAAEAGHGAARERIPGKGTVRAGGGQRRMLINGNEAIALGGIAAGLSFVAGYPMTPTTAILEFLAERQAEFGITLVQPEDEIAAINMVVGASYAGARAMTATSGSGFCLMTEGLGLAGITETPAVVVLGQRPGPAVGLPTRTEQGELLFACFSGTGEFPRAVLTPATIEDCLWAAGRALNLAEKYQTLVIIMTDHVLGNSFATVDGFDLDRVKIERGALASDAEARKPDYKRYQVTGDGISTRAFPMQGTALVVADADEHNEEGHLIEDAPTRIAQVTKRLRKMEGLVREMEQPKVDAIEGADTTLVGWGSTWGAIHEAVGILRAEGRKVNHLHLGQVWPFPADAVAAALGKTRRSYVVENNATGQLGFLIRARTGIEVTGGINRFDGRPFSAAGIVKELKGKE